VINFDRPVGRFSVSNPEIAEAILVTPDQVLVNGKAFGQVNFIAGNKAVASSSCSMFTSEPIFH
jgi:Flp pilus assembly secretin CpaC